MSRKRICRFCGDEGHNSRSCRHVKFVESTLRHEIGDRVKAMTDDIVTANGTGFSNTAGGLVSINLRLMGANGDRSGHTLFSPRSAGAQYRLNQQLNGLLTAADRTLSYEEIRNIANSCSIQITKPRQGFSYAFTGFIEGEDPHGVQRAGKEVKERIERTYSTNPVKYIEKKLKEEGDNYFKPLNEKILDLYENKFTCQMNVRQQAAFLLVFLHSMTSALGRLCGNKRRTIQSAFEHLLANYRFELSKREEENVKVAPLGEKFRSKFMWSRENYTGLEVDFSDLPTEVASVLTEEQKEIIENALMDSVTEDISSEINRAFISSAHHWSTNNGDRQVRHDHLETILEGKLIDQIRERFSQSRVGNTLMIDASKSSAVLSAPQLSSELNEEVLRRIHRYTKSLYRSNGFAKECSAIAHSGGYSQPFEDGFLKSRYAFPTIPTANVGIPTIPGTIAIDSKHGWGSLRSQVSLADIICPFIELAGSA